MGFVAILKTEPGRNSISGWDAFSPVLPGILASPVVIQLEH